MKDRNLIRVNSMASSSIDEPTDIIELRSRGRNQGYGNSNTSKYEDSPSPTWLGNRVLIDLQVQQSDTLNKIALQYSVPVSDLKRANNIVTDQDFHALPNIKIPVSKIFADRFVAEQMIQVAPFRHHPTKIPGALTTDDRRPLLDTDDEDESDEKNRRAKVGALLQRTDQVVAQVRETLSPGLEGGTFHFVDATSPDTTMRNIWLLIFAVIFIFVIMPLCLTLLEEQAEEEAEQRHHHQPQNIQSSSS